MKNLRLFLLLILLTCLLIGCSGGGASEDLVPLEPGDALGEMFIITATAPTPHITDLCEEEELASGTCQVPSDLGQIQILWGWEENTAEELEAAWADSNWELVVDGRQVNLPKFGYWWDEEDPTSHVWAVALKHPTMGAHEVLWAYDIAGEHHEEVWNFTVTDEISFNE
jgi:hypothetical protein